MSEVPSTINSAALSNIELKKFQSKATINNLNSNIESAALESITQNTQVTSSVEKEMQIHIKSIQSLKDTT